MRPGMAETREKCLETIRTILWKYHLDPVYDCASRNPETWRDVSDLSKLELVSRGGGGGGGGGAISCEISPFRQSGLRLLNNLHISTPINESTLRVLFAPPMRNVPGCSWIPTCSNRMPYMDNNRLDTENTTKDGTVSPGTVTVLQMGLCQSHLLSSGDTLVRGGRSMGRDKSKPADPVSKCVGSVSIAGRPVNSSSSRPG